MDEWDCQLQNIGCEPFGIFHCFHAPPVANEQKPSYWRSLFSTRVLRWDREALLEYQLTEANSPVAFMGGFVDLDHCVISGVSLVGEN